MKQQQNGQIAVVTRLSGQSTVKVQWEESAVHPKYQKRYTITRSRLADANGQMLAVGDQVVIMAVKPISKHKQWMVMRNADPKPSNEKHI